MRGSQERGDQIAKEEGKKLKHKIESKIIVFSLQQQNQLRISLLDQTNPQQVFQEIYSNDSLPNEAKKVFQNVSEMFQFLQMNFQSLIILNSKDSLLVDLNNLRIPLKFELPLRLKTFPFLQDLLQDYTLKNKHLQSLIQTQIQQKRFNQMKYQAIILNFQEQIKKFKTQNHRIKSQLVEINLQKKGLEQQAQISRKQFYALEQRYSSMQLKLYEQKVVMDRQNPSQKQRVQSVYYQSVYQSQPKAVQQQAVELVRLPVKKNPFLNGLFSKNISPFKKTQFLPQKPQDSSLVHYINILKAVNKSCLEVQQKKDGIQLNLSMTFFMDKYMSGLISRDVSNVRILNLSHNYITGEGLQTLFRGKYQILNQINLCSNRIYEFDLKKLNFRQITPKIQLLDLNFNDLSKQMFNELVGFSKANSRIKIQFNGVKNGQAVQSK